MSRRNNDMIQHDIAEINCKIDAKRLQLRKIQLMREMAADDDDRWLGDSPAVQASNQVATKPVSERPRSPAKPAASERHRSPAKPAASERHRSPTKPAASERHRSPAKPVASERHQSPAKPAVSERHQSPAKSVAEEKHSNSTLSLTNTNRVPRHRQGSEQTRKVADLRSLLPKF